MATTIWALRRSEATNGRVGFVTIPDDELAGQLLKKGDAQPLRGARLGRVDPAWPDGLRDKLASGKAKRRGRPPKDKGESQEPAPPPAQEKMDLPVKEKPPADERPGDKKAPTGKGK